MAWTAPEGLWKTSQAFVEEDQARAKAFTAKIAREAIGTAASAAAQAGAQAESTGALSTGSAGCAIVDRAAIL